MVKMQRGTLISSDEATITFLLLLDDTSTGANKFIVARLNTRNVVIKTEKVARIKEEVAARLASTMWEEGEAPGAAGEAPSDA